MNSANISRRGLLLGASVALAFAATAGCSGHKIRLDNIPTPGPPTPGAADLARHEARILLVEAAEQLGPGATPVLQVASRHVNTLLAAFGDDDPRLHPTSSSSTAPTAPSGPALTNVKTWQKNAGVLASKLMEAEFAAAPSDLGALIGRTAATLLAWREWSPSAEGQLPALPDTPQVTQQVQDAMSTAAKARYSAVYTYGALASGAPTEERKLLNAQVNRQEHIVALLRSMARAADITLPTPQVVYPAPQGSLQDTAVTIESTCVTADNTLLHAVPAPARVWVTTLMAQSLLTRARFAGKPNLLLAPTPAIQPKAQPTTSTN